MWQSCHPIAWLAVYIGYIGATARVDWTSTGRLPNQVTINPYKPMQRLRFNYSLRPPLKYARRMPNLHLLDTLASYWTLAFIIFSLVGLLLIAWLAAEPFYIAYRRRKARARPFPETWRRILREQVPYFR